MNGNEIIIQSPPEPSPLPSDYPVHEDCSIDAWGTCTPGPSLSRITGTLGMYEVEGQIGENGRDWQFRQSDGNSIPGALVGVENELRVHGWFVSGVEDEKTRVFIGTGGGPSCSPSLSQSAPATFQATAFASQPFQSLRQGIQASVSRGQPSKSPRSELLPRCYDLCLDVDSYLACMPFGILVASGLLHPARIRLQYAPGHSSLGELVWVSADSPPTNAHWCLRVLDLGREPVAELIFHYVDERSIYPPVVFQCHTWDFHQANVLTTAFGPSQRQDAISLEVILEPV